MRDEPWSDQCPSCGDDSLVSVHVLSSAGPITVICSSCGASDRPGQPVRFRQWNGRPEHLVDPRWRPIPGTELLDRHPRGQCRNAFGFGCEPPDCVITHVTDERGAPRLIVWSGPAAPRPLPPTPEEILVACGLDPREWLISG